MEDVYKLKPEQFPKALLEIPQPPKVLYIRGKLPGEDMIYLAVVGSRKYTSYGKDICEKLIRGLKGYPIVIVSGLAIGMDSIAHRIALDTGLATIAFPGSGLDNSVLHPRSNIKLAQEIVDKGGCVISELEPSCPAALYSFVRRNRLMAGMVKAVLIIEAEEKSGTLVTARMALDYNRDVLAVPGSAFSSNSNGTNWLIKQGATPVTNSEEILIALGFNIEKSKQTDKEKYADCGKNEMKIIELLREPMERNDLIRELGINIGEANALLSIMELKDLIKEELGEIRKI
ncbi:MAG: Transcriptional regulator, MarR family [Candidatus Nomurabacteria bacterium GW2011_GWF2_35_66]|uniref:Transcriptional regulator, MarR family n=1 Tax=Candidatus Nomurabacteria bacterium GW2011_GWE1_35_16 TaxID=1618761 RepID=A0A0G0BAF4_9BACT|nr:MAG: Transcriptional regulator, MarR family [Candidatus Nomurabacteria bacterium GW2011_GWF1_34_20]KKP62989.1 MAG: Transcriptional regulator, MarR family [Candidatus Nomurabacteria bacterium GW2011_GWE2_34_25]KKP66393.1 MAG: Transcriptional regulator, MarR family [Candidatus Nomurabacteria bacterium GW2011_GWE1_35_16]KKP83167.1 MAG: Transcriptional regulator, MarR family [Candidatus Nomurabacteria bacterium GW2011_GWF2_35_66]HAE36515.1 DNA-protecting protein DprA [Candidatus Nomurabacteria b